MKETIFKAIAEWKYLLAFVPFFTALPGFVLILNHKTKKELYNGLLFSLVGVIDIALILWFVFSSI